MYEEILMLHNISKKVHWPRFCMLIYLHSTCTWLQSLSYNQSSLLKLLNTLKNSKRHKKLQANFTVVTTINYYELNSQLWFVETAHINEHVHYMEIYEESMNSLPIFLLQIYPCLKKQGDVLHIPF